MGLLCTSVAVTGTVVSIYNLFKLHSCPCCLPVTTLCQFQCGMVEVCTLLSALWLLLALVIITLDLTLPRCMLVGTNTDMLSVPFVDSSFTARILSIAAPKIWNSLPSAVPMYSCLDTFCHHLKTHYFQQACQSP